MNFGCGDEFELEFDDAVPDFEDIDTKLGFVVLAEAEEPFLIREERH